MTSYTSPLSSTTLPLKHVGSFSFLLLLATIRPAGFISALQFPIAPIAALAIGFLLLFKIHHTIGFKAFFQQYKVELLLVTVYEIICTLSILMNHDRYADLQQMLRWGFTFVIIQGIFPVCLLLFLLPQNTTGWSITRSRWRTVVPFSLLGFIAFNAIWQYVHSSSAFVINQLFISADYYGYLVNKLSIPPQEALVTWSDDIMSIFAIGTDLGSISAITVSTLILLTVSQRHAINRQQFFGLILLIALFITAGILSGSRNFILTLGMFCFLLIFVMSNIATLHKLLLLLALFLLVNVATYFAPAVMVNKLSSALPYLDPLHAGQCITPDLWRINIDERIFGARWPMWTRIFDTYTQHPIVGISNGGFRLTEGLHREIYNTHNVFLQIINDSGTLGLIVMLAIAYRVISNVRNNTAINGHLVAIISLSIIATSSVDFFADHNVPWIILCTYCLSTVSAIPHSAASDVSDHGWTFNNRQVYIVCFFSLLLALLVLSHHVLNTKGCYF